MIKLITIEFKKILHKKSLFVVLGLMVIFCFLNNILYWTDYDEDGNYKYETKENLQEGKENLKTELAKYSSTKESDFSMYLSLKTKLDIIELKEKYSEYSWQYKKINDYLYDLLYQVNLYTYVEENDSLLKEKNEEYQKNLEKLTQNDWQYFIHREIEKIKEENEKIKMNLESVADKKIKQELQETMTENQEKLKILEYRLKKDIKEDHSYLNKALTSYQEYSKTLRYYKKLNRKLSFEENKEYQKAQSEVLINQYIIEHQININKQNNLNYQLRTIIEDYEIFFVMIILIVTSIVFCEEFQTGTIKLLLIKPYSRVKILLSKYFTSMLVVVLSIAFLIGVQILIGTIFFGIESLKIPVVVYHYHTESLKSYFIFEYMFIRILANLPLLLMMVTLCFAIGMISMNALATISIPLLLYMFSAPIHNLAVQYHLKWMRFLINMNWDFKAYLFGQNSDFVYVDLKFSLFIWSFYFITLIAIAFVNFKKKNIKNV